MRTEFCEVNYEIPWSLDTSYCHHGIPLSNGIFGALIWFQDHTIMVTINRADYWDHRGGIEWTEELNYKRLKILIERRDFDSARKLYAPFVINGKEKRPTRLPMGRYELRLERNVEVESAKLDLFNAEAIITCKVDQGKYLIRASIHKNKPVLLMNIDETLVESVTARPAYEFDAVRDYFDQFDISPPTKLNAPGMKGWIQVLPKDPICTVVSSWHQGTLKIASDYGATETDALRISKSHVFGPSGYDESLVSTRESWNRLWSRTASISLADPTITTMYYLGIYRMLGSSMPGKIPPTLQGPWVEEFRMPPWSSDYHFNINVQECLWPAYGSNLLDCIKPLFEMVNRWKPRLAQNAKNFVGIEDGYMLNHSTDDLGHPIGGMWTGTIDHANTSWVAQLMWQYYSYSVDETYGVTEVYPFLKSALNVFIAMMKSDGESYALPLSVSPEYGGSTEAAIGRNSTFFLVNVHFLCEKIIEMAEKFHNESPTYLQMVKDIHRQLPPFSVGPRQPLEFNPKNIQWDEEIYLWEGQPLEVSHRHHSHLAGIYPFETIDMKDSYNAEVVMHSYRTWVDKGMGRWAGWSMPWASILHNRMGNPDMALLCLHLLHEVYMMPGFTSRHNAKYKGFSQFSEGDVMQLEASIAASAAILEMFVQCVREKVRVFSALPSKFANVAFVGIRAKGAFILSGELKNSRIRFLSVYSEKGGIIRLEIPLIRLAYEYQGGKVTEMHGPDMEITMQRGETVIVSENPNFTKKELLELVQHAR